MALAAAAARPYARALHALARERDVVDAVGGELRSVVGAIEEDRTARDFFARPWIAAGVKAAAAVAIGERLGVSRLTRDFVGLVARQGRVGQLAGIAEAYEALVDEDRGRLRAKVRTAVPLTDDDRRALRQRLARVLGGRQVVLEEVVDPALLGGFVAEVGTYIVDGSLNGQLARLRERMARG